MSKKKEELLSILNTHPVNALKVREVCHSNPGVIDDSDLRLRVWSVLLLGSEYTTHTNGGKQNMQSTLIQQGTHQCREYQVLVNDVPRTRSDMQEFQTELYKKSLHYILHKFCSLQNIEYKQGLNEICAPFIYMLPPAEEGNSNNTVSSFVLSLQYDLFESFVIRYVERFYCTDSSFFLMKSFKIFHILLSYHDPKLANHLVKAQFVPELYTPQWFLTIFGREVSMDLLLLLWDMFIVIDDPAFMFFIGARLLLDKKDAILAADLQDIPEIVQKYQEFRTIEGITRVIHDAFVLYKRTPKSFIRNLRLCCVASADVTPDPKSIVARRQTSNMHGLADIVLTDWDHRMVLQCHRGVLFISAAELVAIVNPLKITNNGNTLVNKRGGDDDVIKKVDATVEDLSADGAATTATTTTGSDGESEGEIVLETYLDAEDAAEKEEKEKKETEGRIMRNNWIDNGNQTLLIDLRSMEEAALSGGGLLPRGIPLEPSVLDHPDAFSAWLEHVSGSKDCRICIIDMPPLHNSSVALWRRLLLGEGDGFESSSGSIANVYDTEGDINAPPSPPSHGTDPRRDSTFRELFKGGTRALMGREKQDTSLENQEASLLQNIAKDDRSRSALRLARILLHHQFRHISVLEGGFPALVENLYRQRGHVEPVLINHDAEKWMEFMHSTGREAGADLSQYHRHSNRNRTRYRHHGTGTGTGTGTDASPGGSKRRYVKNMTDLEKLDIGYRFAQKLGHSAYLREIGSRREVLVSHVEKKQMEEDRGDIADIGGLIDFR